jgi:hypothetical protein
MTPHVDFYETGWPDPYTDPTSVEWFQSLGAAGWAIRVLDLACGRQP